MKTIIKILVMIVILIQLTDRANAQLNAVNEGSYSVSPINGFMNYTYPISNTTIDGYPVSVKVNYVSNLAFTAFEFHGFTNEDNKNNDLWVKMTKTSPAWIIGVNGFAVQVLTQNQRFHSNYSHYDDRFFLYDTVPAYEKYYSVVSNFATFRPDMAYSAVEMNPDHHSFTCYPLWHHDNFKIYEADNIWLIDGYDFCNSLQVPDNNYFQDFIHLLRDDGSVLELRNVTRGISTPGNDPFTGLYYENGINTNGFAIVETDTNNYWPTYIRTKIFEETDSDLLKPRIVKYYPGNGLEYVFREYVSPYGTREDIQKSDFCGFKKLPKATIFYLEEINSSLKNLTKFERDQHKPTQNNIELLRGRAMIKEFANHKFAYSNNEIVIETFGQKYSLSLKKKSNFDPKFTYFVNFHYSESSISQGMQENNDTIVKHSNRYFMEFSDGFNNEIPNSIIKDTLLEKCKYYNAKMSNGLYYIDKIVDPGGNTVNFGYDSLVVRETHVPRDAYNLLTVNTTDETGNYYFHNMRLNQITTQRLKTKFHYLIGDNKYSFNADTTQLDPDEFAMIDSIEVFDNLNPTANPLPKIASVDYNINFVTTSFPAYFRSCTIINRNYTLGLIDSSKVFYSDYRVKPIRYNLWQDYYSPDLHLPLVTRTINYSGDENLTVNIEYQKLHDAVNNVDINYFISPSVKTSSFRKGTTLLKTNVEKYFYEFEKVNDFTFNNYSHNAGTTGELSMDSAYNWGVKKQTIARYTSLDNQIDNGLVDSTEIFYINLPILYDHNIYRYDKTWDKNQSDYLTLSNFHFGILAVDNIFSTNYNTSKINVPPIYGLDSMVLVIKNGDTIGGIKKVYDRDFSPGPTMPLHRRGALIRDSVLAFNSKVWEFANKYEYNVGWDRNLMNKITDSKGRFVNSWYYYKDIPGYDSTHPPTGNVMKNNQEIDQYMFTQRYYQFERPLASTMNVRNYYLDGSTIRLDTTKLNNISELNCYGLTTGYIDPNGWYYQNNYDILGRTTKVIHPYDFPSNSGSSSNSVPVLECVPITQAVTSQVISTSVNNGSNYIYQKLPPVEVIQFEKLEFGKKLEFISKTDIDSVHSINRFRLTEKSVTLVYQPSQYDLFHRNVTLNDLKLKLLLEVAPNNCSNINIKIPELNYETNEIVGCYPISILQNSCDENPSQYKAPEVMVDLNSVKQSFQNLPLNQTITIILSSSTTGGFMQIPNLGEPYSPCLQASATQMTNQEDDYTFKFEYDNVHNQQLSLAKIDDKVIGEFNDTPRKFANTENSIFTKTASLYAGRYTGVKRVFAASGLSLRDSIFIGNPFTTNSINVFSNTYNSTNHSITFTEPTTYSSTMQLNEKGSPIQFTDQANNNTHTTTEYLLPDDNIITGDVLISTDVANEEFYGLCVRVIQTNEMGIRYTKYLDGMGRLRMTIDDDTVLPNHLRLKTKYLYDEFNRLTGVVNPKGETTLYYYDQYGRVIKKYQIDVDSLKYQFDKTGQLRFSQNKKQKDDDRFSFFEYDDLGRSTIIGEAKINNLDFNTLKPDTLNIGSTTIQSPIIYTSNPSLWIKTVLAGAVDTILTSNQTYFGYSVLRNNLPVFTWAYKIQTLTQDWNGPYLMHPVNYYTNVVFPSAAVTTFEDISTYPQFVKTAVNYDRLPQRTGFIWEKMPDVNDIKSLTPFGDLRNLKGNQTAVAYRDNEDEPFHYVFFSYDARNRVECIVRWTENIGFDVVHYTYNSMNAVNTVTAIDALRQFTTWNVYDDNGRLYKVYTKAGANGYKIGSSNVFPTPLVKPDDADITYTYNNLGAVSNVAYKLGTNDYNKSVAYDNTGKVSIITLKDNINTIIFREALQRNALGNVKQQTYQHIGFNQNIDDYNYDNLNRITSWSKNNVTQAEYKYDAIGNFADNCTKNGYTVNLAYQTINGQTSNRLTNYSISGAPESSNFTFNSIGMVESIIRTTPGGGTTYNEQYTYSTGSIVKSLTSTNNNTGYNNISFLVSPPPATYQNNTWTWNYRTGAFSTREQKRLMKSPYGDTLAGIQSSPRVENSFAHLWEYNLVGAYGEELIQYKGLQTAQSDHGDYDRRVYIAPYRYIAPGGEVRIKPDNTKEIYITDHLGSVRYILSSPSRFYDYDPFGAYVLRDEKLPHNGYVSAASDFEEGESNLMQMGVRMYSPQIGRFLSVDPLFEMMPGQNPYHYAFNSPLMFRDPSGMAPVKEKHSEKLQDHWEYIDPIAVSGRWVKDNEIDFATYDCSWFGPGYTSAEFGGGFALGYLWGTNLSMMGNKGGTGGGDGSGCPYYGNSNSRIWGGITRQSLDRLCNIYESETLGGGSKKFSNNAKKSISHAPIINKINDNETVTNDDPDKIPKRPDADGYITYIEAMGWSIFGKSYISKYGGNMNLRIDINKIDLSKVTSLDFNNEINKTASINLFLPQYFSSFNDAMVYGSITLKYTGKGEVRAYDDFYDTDIHKKEWSLLTESPRNLSTVGLQFFLYLNSLILGKGGNFDPYFIEIRGTAKIKIVNKPFIYFNPLTD